MPVFIDTLPRPQKPIWSEFYNAAWAPFNAAADNYTDNTSATPLAQNKAGDGGEIVFLPPSRYSVNGSLVISQQVELKGALDIARAHIDPVTVFHPQAGKGSGSDEPFITMQPRSGLRTIILRYTYLDGANERWNDKTIAAL